MRVRVGVDLGGTKISAVALDPQGRELNRRRVATPQGDYAATIQAVAGLVAGVTAALPAGADIAETVGIGTPGALCPAAGRIKNANSTCLNGQPLDVDLAAAMARPVWLANDADCLALSEAHDGAGAGAGCVFAVILGTGVGGGLVIDGRLRGGPNAVAGEWGHNPLPWATPDETPGPDCYCGKRGCVETWLSGAGLVSAYEASGGPPHATAAQVAAASDDAATAALDAYAGRLAKALATVINVVDPDVIVLGGGLSNIDALCDEVPARWSRYVFGGVARTPLRRAAHGDDSGVRGAALLVGAATT